MSIIANHIRRLSKKAGAITVRLVGGMLLLLAAGIAPAGAQNLNWEGQTGVFVTPLAYVAPSGQRGIGKPAVSYHFLNAGEVLGNFHQASVTVGLFGRTEFGYTRSINQLGTTPSLSGLWSGSFNIVHGKLSLLPENVQNQHWVPALSVGFVARTQVHHVGGALTDRSKRNADFYLVATKTVSQIKKLPIVLNLGYKATNASVFGLAGNAPAYRGRLFGAVAFVLNGPKGSKLILGSEFAQQPREVEDLPGAIVPTTITYAARIIPFPEQARFNVDLGVAQAAGKIMPGVDLNVRHQFALGISYGF